eukprot:2073419-Rhodomonas_salina.1
MHGTRVAYIAVKEAFVYTLLECSRPAEPRPLFVKLPIIMDFFHTSSGSTSWGTSGVASARNETS